MRFFLYLKMNYLTIEKTPLNPESISCKYFIAERKKQTQN